MLALLIKIGLVSFRNSLHQSFGDTKKRSRILSYLVLIIFPVWIFKSSQQMFSGWLMISHAGPQLFIKFLSYTFTGLLLFLLVSGVTVVLHLNFLAKDLPMLFSLPIPKSTVFSYKFIQATISNSTIFFVLGLPILLALGVALDAPLYYYIFVPLLSIFFISIPTGVASFLMMILLPIFPARAAKKFMTVVLASVSVAAWVGYQFVRVSQLDVHSTDFDPATLQKFADTNIPHVISFLPSYWLAKLSYFASQGHTNLCLVPTIGLLLMALLFYFFSRNLLEFAYRNDLFGFASTLYPAGSKPTQKTETAREKTFSQLPLIAIVQRDVRLIIRDSRQITQLVFYLVLMLILPFVMGKNAINDSGPLTQYMPFIFILIVNSVVMSTLSAKLIPLESLSFQYSKSAPHSIRTFLLAKFLIAYILTLFISLVASLLIYVLFNTPFYALVAIVSCVLFFPFGAGGLGLFIGAQYAKFDWDNPKRMLEGLGTIFITILPSLYSLVGIFILVAGFFVFHQIVSASAFVLFSLALFIIGTGLASKRLDRLEWNF